MVEGAATPSAKGEKEKDALGEAAKDCSGDELNEVFDDQNQSKSILDEIVEESGSEDSFTNPKPVKTKLQMKKKVNATFL